MRRKTAGHGAPDVETFRQKLKDFGLKATPQRIAVHEAMISLVHATADMVADHVRSEGSTGITVASVYNILSGMADLGIYSRRLSPGSRMWFDVNTIRHIHVYDSTSDTFMDIFDDDLAGRIEDTLRRRRIKGYKMDRIDIQLICHPSRKLK